MTAIRFLYAYVGIGDTEDDSSAWQIDPPQPGLGPQTFQLGKQLELSKNASQQRNVRRVRQQARFTESTKTPKPSELVSHGRYLIAGEKMVDLIECSNPNCILENRNFLKSDLGGENLVGEETGCVPNAENSHDSTIQFYQIS